MAVICQVFAANGWAFFIEKNEEPQPFGIRYKNTIGKIFTASSKNYDNFDECYLDMMILFFGVYGVKFRGQQWL
jgi:hypothetical protein